MRAWIAVALVAAALGAAQAEPRVQFAEREIALMRDYYAKKHKASPPRAARRLDRGDSLPAGFEKRALPPELERRLAKLPAGYTRYLCGPDVVLVDRKRGLVVDVVFNVVL